MNEPFPRIWRSPYSRFAGTPAEFPDDLTEETYTANAAYTDEMLQEIAENGLNGIWLHAQFFHITGSVFPELAPHAAEHQEKLRTLIRRCANYGLKVYLYGQILRSVAESNTLFWKNHPDCAGQHEIATEILKDGTRHRFSTISLCPSVPEVRQAVEKNAAELARLFPDLGGVILITASEFHGHCYQRRKKVNPDACYKMIECPRCREREPSDIIAELITFMRNGIRSVSSEIRIILWNWGWSMWLEAPCRELMEKLPADCTVMADFERGGKMDLPERPGHPIDEYSLMYAGPSEEFLGVYECCRKRGMEVMSKLQFGTTHELADAVSIPNLVSVYRKAQWHRKHPGTGYMGCWNFGNFFSANTAGFHYFLNEPEKTEEEALKAFAAEYFPACDQEMVVSAWHIFDQAMQFLPFSIGPLYDGVVSHTLAYCGIYKAGPLEGTPAGSSWQFSADRGDDLSNSLVMHHHEFSLQEIIRGYGKASAQWSAGVMVLERALRNSSSEHAVLELANADICGRCWSSAENTYRIYALRKEWTDDKIYEFRHIVQGEISNLQQALPMLKKNKNLGFHAEPGYYMFSPELVERKLEFLAGL